MEKESKKHSTSTIIVTAISITAILILAFLFYYFTVKSVFLPVENPTPGLNANSTTKPVVPAVVPTNIINFLPPATLPITQQAGNCFANSIAEPYRQDAWRCTVGNSISDPCFETSQKGFVFCQMNPLVQDSFLIKLTKALPTPELPANRQSNWAWFLTLKGGIVCSPFTGTRPFFGTGPDAQVAYYGCKSDNPAEQIVLLGDLTEGNVWKANKATLTKTGTAWTINSTQQVDVETVWQ
jgi:hypothetical protein